MGKIDTIFLNIFYCFGARLRANEHIIEKHIIYDKYLLENLIFFEIINFVYLKYFYGFERKKQISFHRNSKAS